VRGQRGGADPRQRPDLALRLQELLRRERQRQRQELRERAQREVPRRRGNRLVLPQRAQDGRRQEVERREEERGRGEDDDGALRVDA